MAPLPSQLLDLSMDSEQYVAESASDAKTSAAAAVHSRPLLSQDEHAAKLFSVQRSADTNKVCIIIGCDNTGVNSLFTNHNDLHVFIMCVNIIIILSSNLATLYFYQCT